VGQLAAPDKQCRAVREVSEMMKSESSSTQRRSKSTQDTAEAQKSITAVAGRPSSHGFMLHVDGMRNRYDEDVMCCCRERLHRWTQKPHPDGGCDADCW